MRCIQASYKALKEQIAKESVSEAEVREAEAKLEAERKAMEEARQKVRTSFA